jgi:prevent-host-death family protein
MTTEGEGTSEGQPGGHSTPRQSAPGHGAPGLSTPQRGGLRSSGADRLQPDPVHHAAGAQRIGIRELRQHASVYVDLVERGHTVDITNRGRLVAQMIPVKASDSPLERWIAAGVIERADEPGSALEIDPYPALPPGRPTASEVLGQIRDEDRS